MQASLSLKRPREDDDDNVSIASRSPTPDSMDVDDPNAFHEPITVQTKLKSTNKGFAMLAKLGWSEGQPLGLSGDGRVDPVPFHWKADSTGVGKITQDVEMIETTVSQRRGLDSERMTKETEEQRRLREDAVARQSAIATEVSDSIKAFYCQLCDKQFKNVSQYDEHTNSYAHHHKARFRDMQSNLRIKPQEELDKIKEKERRREEKELRKIAAANGIKVAKSSVAPLVNDTAATSTSVPAPSSGFTKVGWAPVVLKTSSDLTADASPSDDNVTAPTSNPPPSAPDATSLLPPPIAEKRPSKAHASRMGWQQFQKSNSRRH